MTSQLKIFSDTEIFKRKDQECIEGFDIHSYDLYLIAFSGGKDSVALFFFVLEQIKPGSLGAHIAYEKIFGKTIKRNESLSELIDKGTSYNFNPGYIKTAYSKIYDKSIVVPKSQEWVLPSGAFGKERAGSV